MCMQDVDEAMDASERALFTQGTVKAFRDKRISFAHHDDEEEGGNMEPEDSDSVPNMAGRALGRQQTSLKLSSLKNRSLGKQASVFQRIDKVLAELSDDDDDEDDDYEDYEEAERVLLMKGLTLEETKRELTARRSIKKKGYHPDHQLMKDAKTKHQYEIQADGSATVTVQDNLAMRKAFLFYCKSAIQARDMHRAPVLPQMAADMFVALCKDLKLVEPLGPLSMMILGITYASFKEDEDDGLSYPSFLDSLVELAFDAKRNVAALLQTMMEEELPQLQLTRKKQEEREQLQKVEAPQPEAHGARIPSSSSAVPPSIDTLQGPPTSALTMTHSARPTTSNVIGGGRGSLTSDYRTQTPLLGFGPKSGSIERSSNPIDSSFSSSAVQPPVTIQEDVKKAEAKPAVPATTAFRGVIVKPDSKPARVITPSAPKATAPSSSSSKADGKVKSSLLSEAAAKELEMMEMKAEAISPPPAGPVVRLNPNLKTQAPSLSPSNVTVTSTLNFRSRSTTLAADDDDEEWGASKTEYSVADLSIEQGMEHLTTSDYLPPRVSQGGSSIMSSRSKNNSTTSPTVTAQPVSVATQPPLFAKRSTVSDDGATRKAQLPSLNSKGANSKGLSKASTGPRTSNEANAPASLSKVASSRTTKGSNASPALSKAPTITRTSNNTNAPASLTKIGSSRMSNSGASPIPKAATMERTSNNAPATLTKIGSSRSSGNGAPSSTRSSNNKDGFVPMKIDWSKSPESLKSGK
jgi:hypothetical protein